MSVRDDKFDIEELHSIFAHAVDRRNFKLARSLYTDDAVDMHGMYNGPVDGYIEWAEKVVQAFESSVHIYTKPLIHVNGDEAESETRGQVFLRIKADQPIHTVGVFRSFDRYRRTDKGWRFTYRALCSDWGYTLPVDTGVAAPPSQGLVGLPDGSDPFFTELPGLAAAMQGFR